MRQLFSAPTITSALICLLCGSAFSQSVGDALDLSEPVWTSPAGLFIQNDVTYDGVDAVQLRGGLASPLRTTLSGPRIFDFMVRVSSHEGLNSFELSLDGKVMRRLSGELPWQKVSLEIPHGNHVVDLALIRQGVGEQGADAVWLDAASLHDFSPVSPAGALNAADQAAISVNQMTAGFWVQQPTVAGSGRDSVIFTGQSGTTGISLAVSGRGILSLDVMPMNTLSASNRITATSPTQRSWIDGGVSPAQDQWMTVSMLQPLPGPATAAFTIDCSSGRAYLLDRLVWTPLTSVAAGEALDSPGVQWALAGSAMAVASSWNSADGEDAVIFHDFDGRVSASISGPARIHYKHRSQPRVTLDGNTITPFGSSFGSGWLESEFFLSAGSHAVIWQSSTGSSSRFPEMSGIDQVTVESLPVTTLGEAADEPALTWSSSPGSAAVGVVSTTESKEGGDLIQPYTGINGEWIRVDGQGEGRLDFSWRGMRSFSVNGVWLNDTAADRPSVWSQGASDLPPDTWNCQWSANVPSGLRQGLDAVHFHASGGEMLSSITNASSNLRILFAGGLRKAGPVTGWDGEPGRQLIMDGNPQFRCSKPPGSGTLHCRMWLTAGVTILTDAQPAGITGSGQWEDVFLDYYVGPPGTSQLQLASNDASAVLVVDNVEWSSAGRFAAADALETPGWNWTTTLTGTTPGWLGLGTPSMASPDGTAMVIPWVLQGESATLSTSLNGGGWLTWNQKVDTGHRMTVSDNGMQAADYSSSGWVKRTLLLEQPGPHAVSFSATRTGAPAYPTGTAIDNVQLLPWLPLHGAESAGVPGGVPVHTSPHMPARIVKSVGSAISPSTIILDGTTEYPCWLEMLFPGPGWLEFDFLGGDIYRGSQLARRELASNRPRISLFEPGVNSIRWRGDRVPGTSVGNIVFTPIELRSPGEALEQPGWTWNPAAGWKGAAFGSDAKDGDDCMYAELISSPHILTAHYPGPGLLRFWYRFTGTGGALSFTAPSVSRIYYGTTDWRQATIILPEDSGASLSWSFQGQSSLTAPPVLLLDDVEFLPESSVSFPEAIDASTSVWQGSPSMTVSNPRRTGDAADGVALARNQVLSTQASLPLWVEYSATPLTSVTAGSATPTHLPEQKETDGLVRRRTLYSGSGPITFTIQSSDSASIAEDAYCDRVVAGNTVSVAEALDTPGRIWTMTPSGSIEGIPTAESINGGDALPVMMPGVGSRTFSTVVTGPGTVALRWKSERIPGGTTFFPAQYTRIELDGIAFGTLKTGRPWEEVTQHVPPGDHVLRIVPGEFSYVLADDFRFTPQAVSDLSMALDAPGILAASVGATWTAFPDTAATGGTALRSPATGGEIVLSPGGAGTFAFRCRATGTGTLTLSRNGAETSFQTTAELAAFQPGAEWQTFTVPLGGDPVSRAVTLTWPEGAGELLLDSLSFTPFTTTSAAAGLDTEGSGLVFSGAAGVSGAAAGEGAAGVLLTQAGPSQLSTTVTGPARVSFRYYTPRLPGISFPQTFETLSSRGIGYQIPLSETNQWSSVTLGLPAGQHTLRWQVAWTSSEYFLLADALTITPSAAGMPSISEAVNLSGSGAMLASAPGWETIATKAPAGEYAAITSSAGPSLSFTVDGAGYFEFAFAISAASSPSTVPEGQDSPAPPMLLGGIPWRTRRFTFYTPGTRTLTIGKVDQNAGEGFLLIDDCRWVPSPPAVSVPIPDALDTPGRVWTVPSNWRGGLLNPAEPATSARVAIASGASSASLDTLVDGPFSILLEGVNNGVAALSVDNVYSGNGLLPVFVMSPGPHKLSIARVSSTGVLSVDKALIQQPGDMRPVIEAEGMVLSADDGIWRSVSRAGTVSGTALQGAEGRGITLSLSGPGTLEFDARGSATILTGATQIPLVEGADFLRHRVEVPESGPIQLRIVPGAPTAQLTVDRLAWTDGISPFCDAAGLERLTVFTPSEIFSVLPGGIGLQASAPNGPSGQIISVTDWPARILWWQRAGAVNPLSLPPIRRYSTTALPPWTDIIPISPLAAGMPPPLPDPGHWSPVVSSHMAGGPLLRFYFSPGNVAIAGVKVAAEPVSGGLPLPVGVELAPGSDAAAGLIPTPAGIPAAMLRASAPFILQTSGPAILSFTVTHISESGQSSYADLGIQVDALPPATVYSLSGDRLHVLLDAGPRTISLTAAGGQQATHLLVSDFGLTGTAFEPGSAIGGSGYTFVAKSSAAPESWPFVTSNGTSGLTGNADYLYLYTGLGAPSILAFTGSGGSSLNYRHVSAPPIGSTWNNWLPAGATVTATLNSDTALRFLTIRQALPAGSLAAALDNTDLPFSADATRVMPLIAPGHAATDTDIAAFMSGTTPATISSSVTSPGWIRFSWRSTKDAACSFSLNNTLIASYAKADWKSETVYIGSPGNLKWVVSAAGKSFELDGVSWIPQHSFQTWAEGLLGSLPVQDRAASDTDNDGAPALIEFALGMDPHVPDAAVWPGSYFSPLPARGHPAVELALGLDGQRYLQIVFPRPVNSGISYQLQTSDGATDWLNTGTLEVLRPIGIDRELCRIRDTRPVSWENPRRLARLRVSSP